MDNKIIDPQSVNDLYNTILSLKTTEDCEIFFADLCTYNEIENMAQRLKAAKMIINGHTYTDVTEATEISSATLSRVSKAVKYGKGYRKFVK